VTFSSISWYLCAHSRTALNNHNIIEDWEQTVVVFATILLHIRCSRVKAAEEWHAMLPFSLGNKPFKNHRFESMNPEALVLLCVVRRLTSLGNSKEFS